MVAVGVRTNTDLAKLIEVHPVSVGEWIAEKNEPRSEHLIKLAKVLNTSPEYLLYGQESKSAVVAEPPPVYVISYAEAGAGKSFEDSGYPPWAGYDSIPRPPDLKDENSYALKVKGDSMAPAIEEGWIVIVAPNAQVRSKDFVVAKDVAENVRLKKVKFDGEIVQLYSVNPAYPPEVYQKKDLIFLHKVYAIIPR